MTPALGGALVVVVAAAMLRTLWVQSAVTAQRRAALVPHRASNLSDPQRRIGTSRLRWPWRSGCDVVAFTETCARSLRSGSTLLEALAEAGRGGTGLDADIALLRRRIDSGASVNGALRGWGEDRDDPDVWLVVTTCQLGHELGGPLADAFDTIAGSIRARRDVAAEARSLSSQARASAALLVALPVLVGALAISFDPSTRHVLLATPAGWACLVGAVVLDAAGIAWMRSLLGRAR